MIDLPIGAWTIAALVDAFGGDDTSPFSELLVEIGIAAAVPTALSGLNDWSDTHGGETRVGLVHATANTTALLLHTSSLVARKAGRLGLGRALGGTGLVALLVGGYLGGHLSFAKGVNINHTAFEHGPTDWTPVLEDAALSEGMHRRVLASDVPVLVYRTAGEVVALANTCTHAGGPLDEGEIINGCVVCPWHGSTFRLSDGTVVKGPASIVQPRYETRVYGGQIEVRTARGS